MSQVRTQYDTLLEMFVGSEKPFFMTITDPTTGEPVDLSSETDFATGNMRIIKPDDTVITTISISFTDRTNGVISFTVLDTVSVIANAGNWIGNIQIVNSVSKITAQQVFNFNILAI